MAGFWWFLVGWCTGCVAMFVGGWLGDLMRTHDDYFGKWEGGIIHDDDEDAL
jgi:hypothetical protein